VVVSEIDVDVEDELIRAMREELEGVVAKELRDSASAGVTGVLVASVRIQRLYFVIRATIMGLMSALITFIVVWYLGMIDVAEAVFLGIFVFIVSLVVSRLFDKQIVRVSKKIVNFLNKHRRLRTFVLKNL
jgi:ABC-type transport system involved in cytochrome bd biosynthesis fused ATPase/permease subunit